MAIEILKTPNIICNEGIKFQTDDIIIQELIDNYVQVIENSQSEENLKLFRRNISKLRIEYKYILFGLIANILKKRTAAQYYLEDNKISMYPLNKKYFGYNISYNTEDFIQDLYHELLHMSSTIIYRDNTIVYSGFSQVGGNIPIGVALDDGYTELLLYRLFNLNKEYMSYKYEVLISSLIEGIISIEKMNNLYFNANLYGLVEELQKYNTRENVIKFLEDLDSIYVIEGRKNYKKDIIYYHNEITKFIVDTYLNKLKKDLETGIITKVEHESKLDKCTNDLHKAFTLLEVSKKRTRERD